MLAEHWSAEVSTPTQGNGRRVDVWKLIPGRDNHFLDAIVGCMAAASTLGCELRLGGKTAKAAAEEAQKNIVVLPKKIIPGKRIVPHR